MGKFFGFVVLVIVVVALVLGGVLWFQAPWLVSNYLSSKYGAPVHVRSVTISPRRVVLGGFRIENWEGSAIRDAFAAERIEVQIAPWKLSKTDVYIPRIAMHNVHVGIELYDLKGTDNNWTRLLARMDEGKKQQNDEDPRHYFVETVTINRIDIQAYTYALKDYLKVEPIENVVLSEVDPDRPLDLGQISAAVYRAMLAKIAEKAILPGAVKATVEAPGKALQGVLGLFKRSSSANGEAPLQDQPKSVESRE